MPAAACVLNDVSKCSAARWTRSTLCAFQCAFWQALEQFGLVLHLVHRSMTKLCRVLMLIFYQHAVQQTSSGLLPRQLMHQDTKSPEQQQGSGTLLILQPAVSCKAELHRYPLQ